MKIAKASSEDNAIVEFIEINGTLTDRQSDGKLLAKLLWDTLPSGTYEAMQKEFARLQEELDKQFPGELN